MKCFCGGYFGHPARACRQEAVTCNWCGVKVAPRSVSCLRGICESCSKREGLDQLWRLKVCQANCRRSALACGESSAAPAQTFSVDGYDIVVTALNLVVRPVETDSVVQLVF